MKPARRSDPGLKPFCCGKCGSRLGFYCTPDALVIGECSSGSGAGEFVESARIRARRIFITCAGCGQANPWYRDRR